MTNLLTEIARAIFPQYQSVSGNCRGLIDEEIMGFLTPYSNRENALLSVGELDRLHQLDSRRKRAISYKFLSKR